MSLGSEGDIETETDLKRAGHYYTNGHFKRADVRYQRVLAREPGNLRARAAKLTVDAALGRISSEDALSRIRELVDANPENERVALNVINMLIQMQRFDESDIERARYFERFPNSPIALQIQANRLQFNPNTKDRPEMPAIVWAYFQRALKSGPLMSPCYREAAYIAARRFDPGQASAALEGASLVERSAIRTRAWGPQRMALVYFAGFFIGALLWQPYLTARISVQSATLAWGLWAIYSNSRLCCKQCRDFWITMVVVSTLVDIAVDHLSTWYIPVGVAICLLIWMVATGKLKALSPPEPTGADAVSTARSVLALVAVVTIVVDSYFVGRIVNHQFADPDKVWGLFLLFNIINGVLHVARYRHRVEEIKR